MPPQTQTACSDNCRFSGRRERRLPWCRRCVRLPALLAPRPRQPPVTLTFRTNGGKIAPSAAGVQSPVRPSGDRGWVPGAAELYPDKEIAASTRRVLRLICSMSMERTGDKQESRCVGCGQSTPDYDIIQVGSPELGYRTLCSQCFNKEMAELDGNDKFEHIQLNPFSLVDCDGKTHQFHFRTRLFGPGATLDAFELEDGQPAGYSFQLRGEPEEDLLVLLGRLIEKIRRALSVKHLVASDLGTQIANQSVQGSIEWDEAEEGNLPMLIIDGQQVTWRDFGRMLMSFEGWQFQLNIRDKSEEF